MEPKMLPDAAELSKIISTRKALLPSIKVSTNEYYNAKDSVVQIAETKSLVGRDIVSFSNPNFGNSPVATIHGSKLIEFVALRMVLPKASAYSTGARAALPSLWGYAAIKGVRVSFGSSNITLFKNMSSIMQELFAQYESEEKASYHAQLGGVARKQLSATELGNITDVKTKYGNWNEYDQEAWVFLNLSTFSIQSSKPECHKSIPSDILTAPISITLELNEGRNFITNYSASNYNSVAGFSRIDVLYRCQEFTDNSFSLKAEILQDPTKVYSMPYYQTRSGETTYHNVRRVSGTNLKSLTPVQLTLSSLETGDLVAILLQVCPSDYRRPGTTYAGLNPFYNCLIEDVRLTYGGDVILNMPSNSIQFFSQYTSNKSGKLGLMVDVDESTVNTDTTLKNRHIIPTVLDLSHTSFAQCTEMIENTVKYISGSLLLEFNIVQREYNNNDFHEYTVDVSYVYPAVLSFSSGASATMLL